MPDVRGSGLRDDLVRRALFLRSMLARPREVGAVWPTSRRAVRDLLSMTDLSGVRRAVEFGVGTGVYTRGILDRLPPDAELLAFEVDQRLAATVAEKLRDPRLRVIRDSAENVENYLGDEKADVIVSSLPFTTLPPPVRDAVLDATRRALASGGALLVLQYSSAALPHLRRRFSRVRRRLSLLNVPPAFLYACDDPGGGGGR